MQWQPRGLAGQMYRGGFIQQAAHTFVLQSDALKKHIVCQRPENNVMIGLPKVPGSIPGIPVSRFLGGTGCVRQQPGETWTTASSPMERAAFRLLVIPPRAGGGGTCRPDFELVRQGLRCSNRDPQSGRAWGGQLTWLPLGAPLPKGPEASFQPHFMSFPLPKGRR